MAENIKMALHFDVDVDAPLNVRTLQTLLAEGDREANRITIVLTRGGEKLSASGMTVEGSMTRADGNEVPITGSVSGNTVTVELNEYCYAVGGPFGMWVQMKSGEMRRTVLLLAGYVQEKGHGDRIDTGTPMPSLDDVIAKLDEMRQVTQEAQDAADYITDVTFNAVEADAPSVQQSTQNGHLHLTFGLVRGIQGERGPAGPDGQQGPAGRDGADGRSFTVMGLYSSLAALQAAHPTGSVGDGYAVGTSENNVIYIWDVDARAWVAIGDLQGPAGPAGPAGAQGAPGSDGKNGADGKDGQDGYTPVRGVDYWTAADINTIKNYVDDAILNGVW